ncbi:histone-lysine N-methyltransferase SETMAR [Trichonephila clavipes]|nr:histone-lysine N-methyltransferase SETMAR [Trichonephila clavipes]
MYTAKQQYKGACCVVVTNATCLTMTDRGQRNSSWQRARCPSVVRSSFEHHAGENARKVAEIANGVYSADNVTANYAQFWLRRFRSRIFDVKDAFRTGKSVVENIDKITEIIENDWHLDSKKKFDVWVSHQLTPKNMMDRISICEALTKRNEIDPFLKRMVTGDEKWVRYENIVRKRLWPKRGEAAQTVAKPGLPTRKAL